MPQIQLDLLIHDKRRRHDLHVVKCRFHLAPKRFDVERPICRKCSWQVVVTDKNGRHFECRIAEDMIRMSVGVYDILDFFVSESLHRFSKCAAFADTAAGIDDRNGIAANRKEAIAPAF
jgi:hypothetical protein